LLQGCHSQRFDKLLNCRTITSCWNNLKQVCSTQQPCSKLSTSWEQAVRTHPVDKLLEQHCYKSAAGLLQLVRFYVATSLLRTCQQLVTCRRYQPCWNNSLRVCWPHRPCYKMITTRSRLVNNWEQAMRTFLVGKVKNFYVGRDICFLSNITAFKYTRIQGVKTR
jgi:hypothetical protein